MSHDALVIGGYTAATGIPADELRDYYHHLVRLPHVTGLEIPFAGLANEEERQVMYLALNAGNRNSISAVPGTMALLGTHPHFGLASTEPEGRAHAVKFVRDILDEVDRLMYRFEGPVVRAVEVHSAPRVPLGGDDEGQRWLAESLGEISEWDWQEATVLIEHSDADGGVNPPVKGFLALEREIAVAQSLAGSLTPIKISLNWGRSVIENRDPAAGAAQVAQVAEAGVLGAVTISGATNADGPFGPAYDDQHAPLDADEPTSLLTREAIADTMRAIGHHDVAMLAVKLGARPADLPASARIDQARRVVEAMVSAS